jgi:hypothetical protein
MTIGIDLGDVWSHYRTLSEDGEVGRSWFRTSPSGVEKWFTDLPPVRIAMEAGTHSIWISEQLQELGSRSDRCKRHRRDSTLRQWVLDLASRGPSSPQSAVVAIARKLAVLLHRIWITQEPYIRFYGVAAWERRSC